MRYRIEKSSEEDNDIFLVHIWPGPTTLFPQTTV